jgi:hypothetical protein
MDAKTLKQHTAIEEMLVEVLEDESNTLGSPCCSDDVEIMGCCGATADM